MKQPFTYYLLCFEQHNQNLIPNPQTWGGGQFGNVRAEWEDVFGPVSKDNSHNYTTAKMQTAKEQYLWKH